jgi:hypothetical protein
MTEHTETVRRALSAIHKIKAPTKRAQAIAAVLIELRTQAEVDEFTQEIRREAHVQDVSLIEDGPYAVDVLTGGRWSLDERYTLSPQHVAELAGRGTDVRISFPDLFQYGTAVFFTLNGIQHRLRTKNFGPSETYRSM